SIADSNRKSSTFFDIHLGKGDEIADYTYNFAGDGVTVRTVAVSWYQGNVRASEASSEDSLVRSDTHKTTSIDSIADSNRKSSTFFDIHLGKGDEIADYTYNFAGDGVTVRTVAVSWYQGNVRASEASSEDSLVRSDTHKTTSIDSIADSNRKSSTFFDIHLGKGDEIADYTYNFAGDGVTVRTVAVSWYQGNVRASEASSEDSLVRSDTHKTTSIDSIADSNRKSSTFFDIHLGKGDEIADYTYNFAGDGVTVRTVAVSWYQGNVRASEASSEDSLVRSDTHKTTSIDSIADSNRKSSTFFDIHLGKGDEIADYTYNFAGDGVTVRTVAVSWYQGNVRASEASSEDSLVRSDTHKTTSIDSIADSNRKSSTFFDIHLGKGDEIADYTYNFAGDGVTVRTVAVSWYQGNVRASEASSEDSLVRSDTHKTTS